MDPTQRMQLDRMIRESKAGDNTQIIREKRHSGRIRRDVGIIEELLAQVPALSDEQVDDVASRRCGFLFANYTDIYNRLRKRQLDTKLLHKFIDALQDVEEGREDQHSASFQVGKILKEIYVDSALKRQAAIDEKDADMQDPPKEPEAVTWREFKLMSPSTVCSRVE